MKTMTEFDLVLAVGKGMDPIDNIPSNVYIAESVPALQLLRKAELVICQGGCNIVKEAILAGIRILTFPSAADQPGSSSRLLFHKLGLRCPMEKATAKIIRQLILQTLQDSEMLQRVERTSTLFRQYQDCDDTFLNALHEITSDFSPSTE